MANHHLYTRQPFPKNKPNAHFAIAGSSSILIDGFFGINVYAVSPPIKLEMKLANDLCLVCSIWHMFLSSSLIVSIMALLRSIILSFCVIYLSFMFFLTVLIRCIPSKNKRLNKFSEIYPLSANSFPISSFTRLLDVSGSRSSTFPGVITKLSNSPLSLQTKCSLNP